MRFRPFHILTLGLIALVALPTSAQAASSKQIHEDATDGSIDGAYTLAEMRAADRSVSAEQREYFGWEDVYAAWLRAQANPDDIAPVVPIDADKDGKIEPEERAAAIAKTRKKCEKANDTARRSETCRKAGASPIEGEPDDAEPRDDDNEPASNDSKDDNGGSPLIWLVAGIPLLVVGLGAWRMRSRKPKGDKHP